MACLSPTIRRFAWCSAHSVLAAALLLPAIANAQDQSSAPPATLGDFNTFGHSWQIFLTTVLQPKLNAILTGTAAGGVSYVTLANGALIAGYTITSLLALYRWVFGEESVGSLVAVVIKGGIISLIYASYSILTSFLFDAAYELSFLIQRRSRPLWALPFRSLRRHPVFSCPIFAAGGSRNSSTRMSIGSASIGASPAAPSI